MDPAPESAEEARGVSRRGLPAKDRIIDAKQAAQIEAARLKALAPSTYRHPDGRPPEKQDFEAFSRKYDQMANERHVWQFARPDGSTYESSWKGIGTGTTAQASADVHGHRVVGEVIPDSTVQGTPARNAGSKQRELQLSPPPLIKAEPLYSPPPLIQAEPPYSSPPLVRAEPPYSPPPLIQAEPPYSSPPLVRAEPPYSPPPLIQAEPPPFRIFIVPWPQSNRINDDERKIKPDSRALHRSLGNEPVPRSASRQQKKPSTQSEMNDEIVKRFREYCDIDPPPRQAAEKLKPVHNVEKEHQEKVRDVVNWAIQAASEARPGTGAHQILTTAQVTVGSLRDSNIPDAGDNLIYRDADHYLAARTQEFKVRAAMMLYTFRNKLAQGSMTLDEAKKISTAPWSTETNQWAVGPLGANQLYENWKLRQFAQEAKGGPVAERSSAAGGTEWELLGMIDFERFDVKDPSNTPHLLVDLPGKGGQFASSPEVPAYLREEAKRIVEKEREAKFTR